MSAISGGGNYVSDGEIMIWLAQQQDRIYGDLRESMGLSERRADFSDALTDIKAHLQEANRSKDFGKVNQELQDLFAKYGDDPAFAEICESLGDMAKQINADYVDATSQGRRQLAADSAKIQHANFGTSGARGPAGSQLQYTSTLPPAIDHYDDKVIETWTNLIDSKLDNTSKSDQLTMIHIQELKATIDQGVNFGSNFIAGSDKASSSIINNIA